MTGLEIIGEPLLLLWVVTGTVLGIVVGAIPGLTGAMLIALALPLTFTMSGREALVLLVSMYVGSVSGGLVTATLLRMPGTPASIVTTFDGYPMAQSGRAGRALGLGIVSSLVGGLLSWGALVLLAEPLSRWSTKIGAFDMFALVLVALVLIVSVSRGTLVAGLFSGFLGILAALPGMTPRTGELRMTLGMSVLNDGFKLLPVLIGLFAFNQVLQEVSRPPGDPTPGAPDVPRWRDLFLKLSEWKSQLVNLLRSSVLGTFVGILPGIGANIGSLLAYSAAKNVARDRDRFGSGADSGVVASEAANNATVGGALVPLIALGIPGSVIDAILLGAFVIHGLQPGRMLFENDPEAVHAITGAYFWANVVMGAVMLCSVRWIARLAKVPRGVLMPIVLIFCVLGSFALANRFFDVWVMLAFGGLGFVLERRGVPLAPFVIGFVLAPVAEENLYKGLSESGGSYLPLVTRPLALVFVVVSAVLLVCSLWRERKRS